VKKGFQIVVRISFLVIFSAGYISKLNAQCTDAIGGTSTTSNLVRCVGEATQLNLSNYHGNITWQSSPKGLNNWSAATSDTNRNVYVYPTVNTDYRAHLTVAGCNDAFSNIISITVQSSGITTQLGYSEDKCGLNFQINAESPTGTWAQLAGPETVTFNSPTNIPDIDISTNVYGLYVFAWTVSGGGCAAANITNFPQNRASAKDNIQHCWSTSKNVQMHATLSYPEATGNWTPVSGTVSILNSTDTNAVVVPQNIGTFQVRWTESYRTCLPQDTIITFDVQRQPVATITNAPDACDSIITLNASDTWGDTKLWQKVSGPDNLNFSNNSSISSSATAKVYGSYKIRWYTENKFCNDADTADIVFTQQPVAQLGEINSNVCGVSSTLAATPSVGTGTWSFLTGQSSATVNQTSDSSATVSIPGSAYGIFNFRWNEVNGVCKDYVDIPITFAQQPVANAGSNNSSCSLNLGLNAVPSLGSGKWISLTGSESLVFSNRNSANANVQSASYGNYNIAWVDTNSYCADTMPITLHFNEQPVAYAGVSDTICGFSKNLEANTSVGSGHWTVTPSASPGFSNSNDANAELSVGIEGNYHIQWIAVNGTCSDTSKIDILFHEKPNAEAGKDTTVCGQELQLNASPLVGFWTIENGAENLVVNPGLDSPNAILSCKKYGTYQLNWIATNSNCSDTSSVQLIFLQKPVANAGDDISLDNTFETEIKASEPLPTENGSWTLVSGTGDLTNQNSATTLVRNLTIGENLFTWNVFNSADNRCSSNDTMIIAVYDIFIPEVITPNSGTENQTFFISGIDELNNVELTIFNRWGLEVYHSASYEDENNWNGTNENGQELTNDTYFYILDVVSRTIKGFVVIKR
jgi:gliding motility-associated-like protein